MEKQILQALQQINETLKQQGETLKQQGETLKEHGETLKEHGLILGALRSGQEALKAELSEFKLQNARDFGQLREQISGIELSVEILKEESWTNKKDIRRVQKTMGLK
ncbi:hypothetical protein [Bacillus sp. T33-2]|uniref:hypothetical protein n=1 Tax=Bacillus sp. T33-2 TaxID=2054168 RepID=UPI000C759AA4|nr:hypothetical protein [Bacillus sp. T33-2]PLR94475.1 hypothetical protein CVD19_17465 [Bacillus sp. T33-2]